MWPFKRKQSSDEEQADRELEFQEFLGNVDAIDLKLALLERDWPTSRRIFNNAPTSEHFAYFLTKAADARAVQDWIDGPIGDEPESVLPKLVKGARFVYWAWEARGEGRANTVSQDAWKIWFRRLKVAEDCFDEVLERDPGNAEAWHWLIVLARARQVSKEEGWRRFNGLLAADPLHYYGNNQMLEGLKAKWSGSVEEMFAFARERAAAAPGTALPSLVLEAHMQNRYGNGGWDYIGKPEVMQEILESAQQSIWHPAFQSSLLTPLLWNNFAWAFAVGERYPEAVRCFDEIGDDLILERTWGEMEDFLKLRNYAYYQVENGQPG